MNRKNFENQMGRLALIYQAGKFDGEEGVIIAREYWKAIGAKTDDQDLEKAVSSLIENFEGHFFPRPQVVKAAVKRQAVKRLEAPARSQITVEYLKPEDAKAAFKKLRESITLKSVDGDVEQVNQDATPGQRCDLCSIWVRKDGISGSCPHSTSENNFMRASGGSECFNFRRTV